MRNLSGKEMERFQGLPDDYTAVDFRGKPLSRTRRGNLIGLGFNCDVVAWILDFLPDEVLAP